MGKDTGWKTRWKAVGQGLRSWRGFVLLILLAAGLVGRVSTLGQQCSPCNGTCPAGQCFGPTNYVAYPTTGCPTNAINNNNGWCCNHITPIVVDLDGSGFSLTSLEGGVLFDMADDGKLQRTSWTALGSSNAWLALDRNSNGRIDDSSELFGNMTPQPTPPTGEEKNGFLALAAYDRPEDGGNGDGRIDPQDAVFKRLLLWQDWNHDGVSQPSEISHLSDFGITGIDLAYGLSTSTDKYGNIFRYRSQISYADSEPHGRWVYDVLLLTGPGASQSAASMVSPGHAKTRRASGQALFVAGRTTISGR